MKHLGENINFRQRPSLRRCKAELEFFGIDRAKLEGMLHKADALSKRTPHERLSSQQEEQDPEPIPPPKPMTPEEKKEAEMNAYIHAMMTTGTRAGTARQPRYK